MLERITVGRAAWAQKNMHIYNYISGRWAPSLTTTCPHWSPGTRSRISARFFWRRDTKLCVLVGGVLLGRGPGSAPFWRRVRHSLAPRRFSDTRGVPSSGAGVSLNGTCSGVGIGVKSRAGRNTLTYFRFGRTRVYTTLVSLYRVEEWVLWGQNLSKQSYHGAFQSETCLGCGTYQ